MAFAVLAISQLVHAFNVRSSHSLFRVGFHTNLYMIGAFIVSLLLMLVVLFVPILQGIFDVTALSASAWWIVIGLVLVPFVVVEIAKGIGALIRRLRKIEA